MKKLTAESFQSIVDGLRSDDAESLSEKRAHPRVGLRTQVDIELDPENFSGGTIVKLTAWLRDISSDGIGIVSSNHFRRGELFIAGFNRERGGMLRVQYSVAHCKTLSKGLYSIGARVDKLLDE